MCARWSPVLLSGDGHTSVRGRREAPRDEAGLCWQLLLQLLCIFQFQVQSRAAIRVPERRLLFIFQRVISRSFSFFFRVLVLADHQSVGTGREPGVPRRELGSHE